MNVPPPYFAANPGKRQALPSPTAEPTDAKINVKLDDHCPLFSDAISTSPPFLKIQSGYRHTLLKTPVIRIWLYANKRLTTP